MKCYKCKKNVDENWVKCSNCKALLKCPQCDSQITENWKRCPLCSVDLDFGKISLGEGLGGISVGIIIPLIYLIAGFLMPQIEFLSFNQFHLDEIFFNFTSPILTSIVFVIWIVVYNFWHIIIGITFLKKGKKEFKENGIFFIISSIFGFLSLFIIRIFAIFIIGISFFMFINISEFFNLIYRHSKIKTNRSKFLKEKELKEEKFKIISKEAKKRLFGMIRSEKKILLDYASELLELNEKVIRNLIYELVAEDKLVGSFQDNIFIIDSDVHVFIDDLMDEFNKWEKTGMGKI